MEPVAVVGIGRTAFTRSSGRSTLALAAEASRAAIADAGLVPSDVDGMISYAVHDSCRSLEVLHNIGVADAKWCHDILGGGNIVCSVVATAAAVIAAGMAEVVVAFRSLNGRSGVRFGTMTGPLEVSGELQFSAPHGYLAPPQQIAMWARRHQHVYGSTNEDLGAIAITERAHAVPNEHAVARTPMTLDDYLAGRWINEPFRVYDCCFEVDGASAIVLTSARRAADLAQPPVWFLGSAESYGGGGSWDDWDDLSTFFSRNSGPRLWATTGLQPSDMDIACMYDCFTFSVMAAFEEYGFCGKGEVGEYFREGRATYGGDVVVNPHGGLLSEGYIHGMNHHYESVLQLRHQAAERQVPDARLALVTSGAGPWGSSLVYGAERP